jgi:ADP-ribose pyrophosphatase YjhB (NUDIX family)
MNYCSNCGQPLRRSIPPGDDRPRYRCAGCGAIHYENPKMVVGCIPEVDGRLLLCRRAIEPCYGKWTLPAGYLENGETVSEGAAREAYEEARARVEIVAPYVMFNICYVDQVYLMFRARLVDGNYAPGSESLEVCLFSEADIPWDELAFTVIRETLSHYYQDRPTGSFPFHIGDIRRE